MASVINGTNIVLYYVNNNATFYFNGSTSVTTIAGESYKQFGSVDSNGVATNFVKTADGIVARFITDVPTTSIPAGTWTFTASASITDNLTGDPRFYYHLYKYNGTTLTAIGTTNSIFFTQLAVKEYTITFSFPATTLLPNERIVIHVIASQISTKTMTFYTQGTNKGVALTSIPVGIPFGSSTNCSFNTSVDQVEVTTTNSSSFKEYLGSQINWSITADGFVALNDFSYLFLLNKLRSKEQILVKFQIDNDNNDGSNTLGYSVVSGLANLVNLDMAGPVEGASSYNVSLQGTGIYTIIGTQVSPSSVLIKGTNVVMFDYTAAGAETFVTWAGSIGLTCVSVTRGGIEVRTIGTVGAPTDENVTFNSSTGTLTFARALESDEFVRAIFK
jgi:predicted secreted protein